MSKVKTKVKAQLVLKNRY